MSTLMGHIGGAPIEELLLPFLATSGTMLVVAARVTFTRATKRSMNDTPDMPAQGR